MGAFTIVTGLGLLVLGFIPALPAALLGMVIVGIGSIGFWTAAQSTIQLIVPDRLVGRVMSLYVALSAGSMPLGSLALGSVAEQGDTRIVMVNRRARAPCCSAYRCCYGGHHRNEGDRCLAYRRRAAGSSLDRSGSAA